VFTLGTCNIIFAVPSFSLVNRSDGGQLHVHLYSTRFLAVNVVDVVGLGDW
jgi:hypothetical protein